MVSFKVQGTPVRLIRIKISNSKGKGNACYDDETTEYIERIRQSAIASLNGSDILKGPLAMIVDCTYPIPDSWPSHRRQAALHGAWHTVHENMDGLCEVVAYALKGVVYDDSSQISVIVGAKKYGAEGETMVSVYEMNCIANPRWLISNLKMAVEAGTL